MKIVPINPLQGINEYYPFPLVANELSKCESVYLPKAKVFKENKKLGYYSIYYYNAGI